MDRNGSEFGASGIIEDYDANNVLISTGCFTHPAKRLSDPGLGGE